MLRCCSYIRLIRLIYIGAGTDKDGHREPESDLGVSEHGKHELAAREYIYTYIVMSLLLLLRMMIV